MKAGFLTIVWFLLFSHQAVAEGDSTRSPKNRYVVFGVPTLGTAPETGFYFGAVGLLDIIPRGDSLARHSVVKLELSYTLKNQFIVGAEWLVTNKSRTWMWIGDNGWLRFPEMYWGIGAGTNEQSGFLYSANRLELTNAVYRKAGSKFYVGLHQRLQSVYQVEIDPANFEKVGRFWPGSEGTVSSGFGLGVLRDSRTNILNPRAGEVYASIVGLAFGPLAGSAHTFQSLDMEARYYLKVGSHGILAGQGLLQLKNGDVPFRMMSLLGSDALMRGYYQGRFRDQSQWAAQLEYRQPIWNWVGATAFGSIGNVFSGGVPSLVAKTKYAGGIGLRLRVDKKENTNMRFDYALNAEGGSGFYVSFGEAF